MFEDSILKTINFFDLFDHPLTKEEVFLYLWDRPKSDFAGFSKELDRLTASGLISEKWGLYFLPGKETSVEERQRSVPEIESKLKKARRAAKLISAVPFLRAVFVCNSISFGSASRDSDIDFFVVAEKGRVWQVRFFTNLILFLFGMRRHGEKVADRICLSFYVDTNHLDLSPLKISDEDVYLAYWLKQLIPIYDPTDLHKQICVENTWCKDHIRLEGDEIKYKQVQNGYIGKTTKNIWEKFWGGTYGDLIERECKKIQLQKIKISGSGKVRSTASAVVVEDGVLKFHEKDIRLDILNKWKEKGSSSHFTYEKILVSK